jgi:hypothetical protein
VRTARPVSLECLFTFYGHIYKYPILCPATGPATSLTLYHHVNVTPGQKKAVTTACIRMTTTLSCWLVANTRRLWSRVPAPPGQITDQASSQDGMAGGQRIRRAFLRSTARVLQRQRSAASCKQGAGGSSLPSSTRSEEGDCRAGSQRVPRPGPYLPPPRGRCWCRPDPGHPGPWGTERGRTPQAPAR